MPNLKLDSRLVSALAFLPYLPAVLWPAWTPTRALMMGWIVESGAPNQVGPGRGALGFALRHGIAWLVLHQLRADAGLPVGVLFLAAVSLARPLWVHHRRARAWSALGMCLLLLPAVLSFVLALDRNDPAIPDVWKWAGEVPREAEQPVPDDLPSVMVLSTLPFRLPLRLVPYALEDEHRWIRALLVILGLGLSFVYSARAAAERVTQVGLLQAGIFLLSLWLGGEPPRAQLLYQERTAAGEIRQWRLEVHPGGGDLYDPTRDGPVLPPSQNFVAHVESDRNLIRMVSPAPWAVARELDTFPEAPEEPVAWMEVHTLRAPKSGGPLAADGGLDLLRWWAGGEQLTTGGARWELHLVSDRTQADRWILHRRPLE